MTLKNQKRLSAEILKCGATKVHFDSEHLKEIKEAITKADLRVLVKKGYIYEKKPNQPSRVRARKRHEQKVKGRRKGLGTRKGTFNARAGIKEEWMIRVRLQRSFLKQLKEKGKITTQQFRKLYLMSKGGFFRTKAHLKLYLEKMGVFKNK